MMGKTVVKRLGGGRVSLDLPMAALAALSVAFVAYAMPDALFSGVVEASGLPSILPAAQPPLGLTARLAVVGTGAAAAFISTWLLLGALGNGPSPARRRKEPEEVQMPPLRLRRADAHPDAPLRRPLVAPLDLGEPDFAKDPVEKERERTPPESPEAEQPIEETAQEEPEEEDAAVPFELSPMELEEPTIAHLMQRLELGLIRRRQNDRPSPEPEQASVTAPVPSAADDRLRSALDDLQRMARGA